MSPAIFPGKWFARAETKYQQNTELDLDSRVQGGLGSGYDIVRSNSQRLYGLAGLLGEQGIHHRFIVGFL